MLIVIIALVAIALYVVSVYNGLQTLKTRIVASIQEIGNQLKRQASLIPNLQESVKAYFSHEKGIFQMLTDARKSVEKAAADGSMASADKAASQIQAVLPKIQVLVESNPQLQANATVTQFMDELRDTADKLTYARRTLIDLSQEFNMRLLTFPSSLVASLFGFKAEDGLVMPAGGGAALRVSADEMADPKVKLN